MDFPKAINIGEKINLYVVNTKKFNSTSINIFFHQTLDYATQNALIPLVLRRGTKNYPTLEAISKKLEELYGAVFDCNVVKKGERHILKFGIQFINLPIINVEDIMYQSMTLLADIILNPVLENGAFKSEYVNQEKDNLKRIIESKVNNKAQYAMQRCIEEMCKDEPYSTYEYGKIEDLEGIDSNNLYDYYMDILKSSPIDIFVVGQLDQSQVISNINQTFKIPRQKVIEISPTDVYKEIYDIKKVNDRMNITQGKLCLGFRTNTPYNSDDYYGLILYSNILGGGLTSKLFINVREKASLAYTISSRLDKFKGLMFVTGGIDFDNYEKAIDMIFLQIDEIKKGNISDEEYYSSIKEVSTSIRWLKDSHNYIIDFFLSQLVSQSRHTFEEVVQKIENVKKQDISRIAQNIKLDTIYFLQK